MAPTRAAVCTLMPPMSSPRNSTHRCASQLGLPSRALGSWVRRVRAHRITLPGASKAAALARLVGVDGTAELPLALIELGPAREGDGAEVELPPLEVEVEPISVLPLTFPLVVAAHRAGDLSGPEEVAAWRRASAAFAGGPAPVALDPPSGRVAGDDQPVEAVIDRRGSTRLMRRETVAGEAITWGMAVRRWTRPSSTKRRSVS